MAKLEWDGTLVIGVDDLDKEHHQLALLVNLLNDALRLRQEETARSLFATLERKAGQHCEREQAMLRRYEYPRLETVRLQHNACLAGLRELGSRLEEGDAALAALERVGTALVACIQSDKRCVAELRGRGIEPSPPDAA